MSSNSENLQVFPGQWDVESAIKSSQVDGSFYLCNLSDVIKKFHDWNEKLPRVKPFYAVKCNDDERVLRTLASIGCSFDCASAGEIEKILALNVNPCRIIYANTTKISSHIEFAKAKQINLMTFDNEDEIFKISKVHKNSEIRYSSEKARYKLGKKFGCDPVNEAPDLLKLAKKLNLKVVGISFHVGSSCEDYEVYVGAIKAARTLFEIALGMGFEFHYLDLGGGYPGDTFQRIDEFAGMFNKALDESFPATDFPDLVIISEPGRYFVESAFSIVTLIHSRKLTRNSQGEIEEVMYYLNEGVYSNFLFIPLGPEIVEPKILSEKMSSKKYKTTIWGPTCDSTDVLCRDIDLELLEIGDIIYFNNMGAYTIPLRTPFNGFELTKVFYFIGSRENTKE